MSPAQERQLRRQQQLRAAGIDPRKQQQQQQQQQQRRRMTQQQQPQQQQPQQSARGAAGPRTHSRGGPERTQLRRFWRVHLDPTIRKDAITQDECRQLLLGIATIALIGAVRGQERAGRSANIPRVWRPLATPAWRRRPIGP